MTSSYQAVESTVEAAAIAALASERSKAASARVLSMAKKDRIPREFQSSIMTAILNYESAKDAAEAADMYAMEAEVAENTVFPSATKVADAYADAAHADAVAAHKALVAALNAANKS